MASLARIYGIGMLAAVAGLFIIDGVWYWLSANDFLDPIYLKTYLASVLLIWIGVCIFVSIIAHVRRKRTEND